MFMTAHLYLPSVIRIRDDWDPLLELKIRHWVPSAQAGNLFCFVVVMLNSVAMSQSNFKLPFARQSNGMREHIVFISDSPALADANSRPIFRHVREGTVPQRPAWDQQKKAENPKKGLQYNKWYLICMAFDIKVDCKIVLQRLHYSFSQSWYLFILEFAPAETENSLKRSQDAHTHPQLHRTVS